MKSLIGQQIQQQIEHRLVVEKLTVEHRLVVEKLTGSFEKQQHENHLFAEKVIDKLANMNLNILLMFKQHPQPHQQQNTGPNPSTFNGSFMDDDLESLFKSNMKSSSYQAGS